MNIVTNGVSNYVCDMMRLMEKFNSKLTKKKNDEMNGKSLWKSWFGLMTTNKQSTVEWR